MKELDNTAIGLKKSINNQEINFSFILISLFSFFRFVFIISGSHITYLELDISRNVINIFFINC